MHSIWSWNPISHVWYCVVADATAADKQRTRQPMAYISGPIQNRVREADTLTNRFSLFSTSCIGQNVHRLWQHNIICKLTKANRRDHQFTFSVHLKAMRWYRHTNLWYLWASAMWSELERSICELEVDRSMDYQDETATDAMRANMWPVGAVAFRTWCR